MVVVIAISSIASFTLVNQSFLTGMSIFRLLIIFGSAFLGLFGFFTVLYLIVLYVASIRVLGVPYLNITADLNWTDIKKSFVRLSPKEIGQEHHIRNDTFNLNIEEERKLREEILPKQNEKVMNMLKDISKKRGGKISLSHT